MGAHVFHIHLVLPQFLNILLVSNDNFVRFVNGSTVVKSSGERLTTERPYDSNQNKKRVYADKQVFNNYK